MEITNIFKIKNKVELPEYGDLWQHDYCKYTDGVYLRIDDEAGARALCHDDKTAEKLFYSVNIKSGIVYSTNRNDTTVQILPKKVAFVSN